MRRGSPCSPAPSPGLTEGQRDGRGEAGLAGVPVLGHPQGWELSLLKLFPKSDDQLGPRHVALP